jgi:hypothetical protein
MPPEPRGLGMRRREFLGVLGSVAAAWPLAGRAQQTERVRRIGALTGVANTPTIQERYTVFQQRLQQLGWTDGRNMRIDYRYGGGSANTTRKHAAELATLAPDVIHGTRRHEWGNCFRTGETVGSIRTASRHLQLDG